MPRYAYVITRTDDDRDEEDRVMSSGTRLLADGQDPAAFAAARLVQNRVEHSYYTGPRRIAYWPHQDGALPRTAPAGSQHLDG
ncbi:hypothetical protein ACIPXV_02855 [Streptomyces libani]|uniref:hypothetical protein n=1 Tax=Streptomyces nigrescens TaxID=1920 RepID=UPI0037F4204F